MAPLLREKYFPSLTDEEFDLLLRRVAYTPRQITHDNITVQTCFDADRLDLGRVGKMSRAKYLCTDSAKSQETIAWAYQGSIDGDVPDNVLGMFVQQG